MSVNIRGDSDATIDEIKTSLADYEKDHQNAEIEIYRQNCVSVRIRIIDTDFRGLSRSDRHQKVWKYLGPVSDETISDVTLLLLLTPEERQSSFANFEFENPVPSAI